MNTLNNVIKQVVENQDTFELRSLIKELPHTLEEAADVFCERFELGNWFYEQMVTNEVNVTEELVNICDNLQYEEDEAGSRADEDEMSYRLAVA